jgi:5'-nucleotidase
MHILITNDDGILAPGIEALYAAVRDLGMISVVAPDDSQSAVGHAISVLKPLMARRMHVNQVFEGWSVTGRPADCVKLAMIELLEQPPDLVLSGINAGANAGVNVLYSGTVAAAMEGALFGVPAVAFSLALSDNVDFGWAGRIARGLLERILASQPAPGTCLSVNIPALDRGAPHGVRICPQAPVSWEEHFLKEQAADGTWIYRLDGRLGDHDACPDSDLAAIREGYVSVTPLRPDLTAREHFAFCEKITWPQALD